MLVALHKHAKRFETAIMLIPSNEHATPVLAVLFSSGEEFPTMLPAF